MNSSSEQLTRQASDARRADVDEVVDRIVQVVPRVMRRIRSEMRVAGGGALTVPQLRALLFVRRRPGTGLSPLAEHLGMTPPSTSALVERLVRADLLDRAVDPDERRRIMLRLTPSGAEHLGRAHLLVRSRLSADLRALSAQQLEHLSDTLDILNALAEE